MSRTVVLCVVVLTCISATAPGATPLYDGTLGTRLDEQGWLYQTVDPVPPLLTSHTFAGGATVLNSMTDPLELAGDGIMPPGSPVLDRAAGFTLQFTAWLDSEVHLDADRAGFSIVVVTSDLRAIELGFWPDRIFAQTDLPLFTHGEELVYPTTAPFTQYNLTILGNAYALTIEGVPGPTLAGPLRDYTAWVPPAGFPDPYEIPGLIFLGDDTTSAGAIAHVARVAYVPEPATIGLLGAGALLRLRRRRRRAQGR
jgi:hypothetical protein